MSRWTQQDVNRIMVGRAVANLEAAEKRQKYNASKTQIDGHSFDSKKEGARYVELTLMQKAGQIRKLECQPRFDLHTMTPSGEWVKVGRFTPDFRYETQDGAEVVEDVKGGSATRTEAYQMRKRHWEAETGRTLMEIG